MSLNEWILSVCLLAPVVLWIVVMRVVSLWEGDEKA